VFDQFELAATVRARSGREELAAVAESLWAQVASLDNESAARRDELAAAQGEIGGLSQRLASAVKEIEALRTQVEDGRKEIAELHFNLELLVEHSQPCGVRMLNCKKNTRPSNSRTDCCARISMRPRNRSSNSAQVLRNWPPSCVTPP
jgi:chromosome segregation ATPase